MIETVPSTTQPSRSNQQYPPVNLWQTNDSTSQQQQQQQLFMSGIQRPFPGLPASVQSTSSSIAQLTNANPLIISGSSSTYLPSYPNLNTNSTATNTFLDDQANLNRHFPSLDTNLGPIDLGVGTQFQTGTNSTNSFYSQRTHTSPSAAAVFPPNFGYVQPSFNHLHHHHHHHLTSNVVDDTSFLIQNPSLT